MELIDTLVSLVSDPDSELYTSEDSGILRQADPKFIEVVDGTSTNEEDGGSSSGAGAIVAIILVCCVILVGVFVVKRRRERRAAASPRRAPRPDSPRAADASPSQETLASAEGNVEMTSSSAWNMADGPRKSVTKYELNRQGSKDDPVMMGPDEDII